MLNTVEKTLPGSRGAVLQAIILGARERLSLKDRVLFRNTGTAHLLAISGLHVGFIAVAVFWALRTSLRSVLRLAPEPWGLRFAPSRWAALGTAPAVLFYAQLVGGRVATVRASIMILVYLASRVCRTTRNHFHAVALAALLILMWNPGVISDIGFQLSFTAVSAILLALRRYERGKEGPLPSGERTWGGWLRERVFLCLLISIVAFLATWPLIARSFHRVALISPLANALVFPIASITIPLGLAAA
jgi:competence protein ComEC